jgi:cation diffusion facilitator CzcD-associated flavoprotein CzcO
MPSVHREIEAIPDILDVLIVGAGLSGIGAAHRLQRDCPAKRYAIVEARASLGGTWDLFRYPGIRSDSDMYTLGYDFKPWGGAKAIAEGPAILRYIRETADAGGITSHIRFGHAVRRVEWSTSDAYWTVTAERAGAENPVTLRARFLYMCCGYFSFAQGHRPQFLGEADYLGSILQPQFWPEDLDYSGKRVVVIGSGATAVTLVPEIAKSAAHVTMLQRSPTYVVTRPSEDRLAQRLRRHLPSHLAYRLTRWKNVLLGMFFYQLARRRPETMKQQLIALVRQQVGPSIDVDTHFTPRYRPWDQRMCLVPDGDLFHQLREGRASVVTDSIERFTARGLKLASGRELPADIVVVATGLKLNVLGDVSVRIDGHACDLGETMVYKGMLLSDVPNLAMAWGYTNASWTLKADLTAGYVCRLLQYMDRHGHTVAVPRRDPAMLPRPFLTFSSGYIQRALAILPKQGTQRPWRVHQNYLLDLLHIRYGRIADGVMRFTAGGATR